MLSITKCLAIKPAPKRPGHACVLIRRNARSRAHSSRSETDSRRRVPRACSRKSAAVVHCPLVRTRGNGQNAKRLDSSRQKKEGAKTETERGRERERERERGAAAASQRCMCTGRGRGKGIYPRAIKPLSSFSPALTVLPFGKKGRELANSDSTWLNGMAGPSGGHSNVTNVA